MVVAARRGGVGMTIWLSAWEVDATLVIEALSDISGDIVSAVLEFLFPTLYQSG